MHVIWIILEVLGGLTAIAVVLVVLFALSVTKDGSNPFQ